jgi:hypothetical protein
MLKLHTFYSIYSISLTFLVMWTMPAFAAFPCTWGPGEYQVGDDKGVPLCEKNEMPQGGRQQTEPKSVMPPRVFKKMDTTVVVVMHPDADDPWMIWDTFLPDAREKALAACEQAMQDKKCEVREEGKNIAVALVYKDYHLVDAVAGKDKATAKENARKKCGNDCLIDSIIVATPQYYYGGIDTDTKTYFPTKEKVRLKTQNALKPR